MAPSLTIERSSMMRSRTGRSSPSSAVLLVRIPTLLPNEFWLEHHRLAWQPIKDLEAEGTGVNAWNTHDPDSFVKLVADDFVSESDPAT
jgi:hypothetical protein